MDNVTVFPLWDNFPAYIAGETKPKVLTEEEKDWIVEHHNSQE